MNYDLDILNERENSWIKKRNDTFKKFYDRLNKDKITIDLKNLNYTLLNEIYEVNKSITQSFRSTSGKEFERLIKNILDKENISYSYQVYISKTGNIIKDKKKAFRSVDFVIPKVNIGDNIKNKINEQYKYTLISCKTTLRERVLQDSFCKNLYIITLDDKIRKDLNFINKIKND